MGHYVVFYLVLLYLILSYLLSCPDCRYILHLVYFRGPNWIHGTLTNPILELAKQTQTVLCSIQDRTSVYNEQGGLIEDAKAADFFELVWGIISDAFKDSNESCSTLPSSTSLKDYFIEKISPNDLGEDDKKLVYQMAEIWGTFIGDPLDRQSLKYFWLEECLDGGNANFGVQFCTVDVDHHQTISSWPIPIARSSPVLPRKLSIMPKSISRPRLLL